RTRLRTRVCAPARARTRSLRSRQRRRRRPDRGGDDAACLDRIRRRRRRGMSRDATTWRELVLDPASAPHRRIRVEASAGTGKAWTVSAIYLRLVVEHGLRPESIVVSTFTDAAAAELRERIRTRLLWALRSGDDGTALAA